MQVDDPPYLSVGTAVSAKYKGAFCEAKVSKVVRLVKCKVTYKMGLGTATLTDEQIKGTLRVGQLVQAKHSDKKELVDANITKIQDCSQYTVVFDDGDITTLRRTALCLKSGRHFNESETLDQLPLTHPEHFGNPVVGGRRGRRNRQLKEDSSDGEVEEENEPDLEAYLLDLKRVVSVETTEKKRNKDNWFPGLVVIPSAQPTVRINMKDEYLIRSFKDGRYYTVPKKEVNEFNRELAAKVESTVLSEAIQKAIRFLDHNDLPPHWEKNSLFQSHNVDSESDEIFSDSSDDEPSEEKDRFVAQLYKFMDEAGTPLNKTPTIANQDIDLHRLFRIVEKLGGYNRVTNQNKWRTVSLRMHLPGIQSIFNQVKAAYKKCLSSYETFYRTLGVTMLNHTRSTKKNKGRSLIRDRDRSTPISSPASVPDKEENVLEEKKEVIAAPAATKEVPPEPVVKSKRIEKKRALAMASAEVSDTNSSDTTDPLEVLKEIPRPKREMVKKEENRNLKEKEKDNEKEKEKKKTLVAEKVKTLAEKSEEQPKKDDEKVQNTRSKAQSKQKEVPAPTSEKKPDPKLSKEKLELRTSKDTKPVLVKMNKKPVPPIPTEEEKKKGKKRPAEEKTSALELSEKQASIAPKISIGDKLKVFYGSSNESKVTYEAKVIEIDKDQTGQVYLVHYTGWNTRYDEWIQPQRIAENLSATKKAKRSKQPSTSSTSSNKSQSHTPRPIPKRTRVTSVSARSSTTEVPRSTTPSSVTSSGSRTKSPATPATRSTARLRQARRTRRISVQTDVSIQTESDSEGTESDSEVSRTRSRTKSENEPELKTYRRRPPRAPVLLKQDKRKDREEGGPPKEEFEKTRSRKMKKSSDKSGEDSEEDGNPPKGRDFDLNQIRSELKGFTKAIKLTTLDSVDKEAGSSSDGSSSPPLLEKLPEITDETSEKKEKSSSSEDIYEFKEPEPFEFENRPKLGDEKKRLGTRIFEEVDKSSKLKTLSVPLRKQEDLEDSDEDEDEEEAIIAMSPPKEEEDPFDKLVESPSFNLIKTLDKVVENKEKIVRNISDDSLSLFRDLPPDAADDYSGDMELSDCESPSQIFTTSPEKIANANLFGSSSFSKPSPDQNTLDLEFSSLGKMDEEKNKDSDDEDSIREQIQRVIAQSSSTDDDSNDALAIRPPNLGYSAKKREETISTMTILGINVCEPAFKKEVQHEPKVEEPKEEKITTQTTSDDKPSTSSEKQHISPALQETDSTLLESIVSHPPVSLDVKLEETAKEISNIKTGTKIADSILQKFNSIKNEIAAKVSPKRENVEEEVGKTENKLEITPPKEEPKPPPSTEDPKPSSEEKPEPKIDNKSEEEAEEDDEEENEEDEEEEIPSPPFEEPIKKPSESSTADLPESKKRKKVLSRAYIEDSETDSSDSEQLVIARSDDDSQTTSLDNKPDTKESDNSNIFAQIQTTDESLSQEELNFNFETKKEETRVPPPPTIEKEVKPADAESPKEDDPDPHLHSLLLCEEEIPRSPAPPSEPPVNQGSKMKSVLEMPFASAPSTSNNKSMLLEQKKIQPAPNVEVHVQHAEREREHRVQNSTVLDNTPPTTPESTISNLSPRGDTGGLSPTLGDNESGKSNDIEPEYPRQRSSVKVSPYSEEDTQMGEMKKPLLCKRRRKSLRNSEDTMPLSIKKSKKNRSRHNSDSDDTSEYSNTESTKVSYNRSNRSPRPSKYNFYVDFDPTYDSGQRIAVLQQKLSELRKTYADVKAELAAVERRRKKIRRREREALKAAKQEMACA